MQLLTVPFPPNNLLLILNEAGSRLRFLIMTHYEFDSNTHKSDIVPELKIMVNGERTGLSF